MKRGRRVKVMKGMALKARGKGLAGIRKLGRTKGGRVGKKMGGKAMKMALKHPGLTSGAISGTGMALGAITGQPEIAAGGHAVGAAFKAYAAHKTGQKANRYDKIQKKKRHPMMLRNTSSIGVSARPTGSKGL